MRKKWRFELNYGHFDSGGKQGEKTKDLSARLAIFSNNDDLQLIIEFGCTWFVMLLINRPLLDWQDTATKHTCFPLIFWGHDKMKHDF
jgi:hypothetical protein